MSRKVLSWAAIVAVFTLVLSATDAEARHCRSHYRNQGCCQNSNYGYGNYGYQRSAGYGYGNYGAQQSAGYNGQQPMSNACQQTNYVTTNACCNPQPTCCTAQASTSMTVTPENSTIPQPPTESAPAPAAGN